ncbi:hypothetical protein MFLO_00740 [Listeria floridensis FSL S10-1187]|uniref:Uncharacterized protein n=1 Tax=Listeria floridensis FSL S10-1187 TaxID=1265817 RepID=A0ABN0RIH9_9LIST|nr:hypothetical protein [Listeria floridensis]EUJ33726.1 hypothetical protein MFLO_00740 [Listeria floridensis FSL S10-1187]
MDTQLVYYWNKTDYISIQKSDFDGSIQQSLLESIAKLKAREQVDVERKINECFSLFQTEFGAMLNVNSL